MFVVINIFSKTMTAKFFNVLLLAIVGSMVYSICSVVGMKIISRVRNVYGKK